jgi:uncharacterized membrane protein YcaP (DUF421 family)
VVRDGRLLPVPARQQRFTESDLLATARQQGIRDLADIELSVLEADGTFSFFTRGGDQGGEDPAGHDATDAKKEI